MRFAILTPLTLFFAMLVVAGPISDIDIDTRLHNSMRDPFSRARIDGRENVGHRVFLRAKPLIDPLVGGFEKRESIWNKIKDWFTYNFAAPTMQNGYGGPH